MASKKISQMDAAAEVKNDDLVPIVSGGQNYRATRALLLTSEDGEIIALVCQNNAAAAMRNVENTKRVLIDTTADLLEIFSDENISIEAADSCHIKGDVLSWILNNGAKGIHIDPDIDNDTLKIWSDQILTIKGDEALNIKSDVDILMDYIPGDTADWDGADPQYVYQALNRLAACVATLNGGPIP